MFFLLSNSHADIKRRSHAVAVTGAEAGTLTFMVGGEDEHVEQAKDVLACMGKSTVHCGGPGTGGVTKLCNNLALAIEMVSLEDLSSVRSP